MINPISFTGTYKITSQVPFYKFERFQALAQQEESEYGGAMDISVARCNCSEDTFSKSEPQFFAQCVVTVDDRRNKDFEQLCDKYGLMLGQDYKRVEDIDFKILKHLRRRITKSESPSTRLVNINKDKFEKLLEKQHSDFKAREEEYNKIYSDTIDKLMLKSSDEFPTTRICFFSNEGIGKYNDAEEPVWLTSELLKQLQHDPKSLKDNQLYVTFSRQTYFPDQCVYFSLRDMGLKDIPVYMDETSYRIACILGIISN